MFFNFIVFIIDIPLFKRYHTNRLNNNDIKRAIKITFWRKSMKKLSISKMADTVISKRKELKITQVQLAEKTGINRGMISPSGKVATTHLPSNSFSPLLRFLILKLLIYSKTTNLPYRNLLLGRNITLQWQVPGMSDYL